MNIKAEVKTLRSEGYIEGELSIDPLLYIIWEPENIEEYNNVYELYSKRLLKHTFQIT